MDSIAGRDWLGDATGEGREGPEPSDTGTAEMEG